jgi:trehalose 6-phosphate phosphatase
VLAPATLSGRRGLAAILAEPSRALIALDYDGTLAPIVDDPAVAVPIDGAVEVLAGLASQVAQVAIITGRAVEVVVPLGGLDRVPGLVVLGQYGAQRWCDGQLDQVPPPPGLAAARSALAALDLGEGVTVEDKGLSLTVHTRTASNPEDTLERIGPGLAEVARQGGLGLHAGRFVWEIRPVGKDKGAALRTLLTDRGSVLLAGDDLGDVAACDEVEAFRTRGGHGLVVCSDSDEAPAELRASADLAVPGPGGVVALLTELLELLAAGGEGGE